MPSAVSVALKSVRLRLSTIRLIRSSTRGAAAGRSNVSTTVSLSWAGSIEKRAGCAAMPANLLLVQRNHQVTALVEHHRDIRMGALK